MTTARYVIAVVAVAAGLDAAYASDILPLERGREWLQSRPPSLDSDEASTIDPTVASGGERPEMKLLRSVSGFRLKLGRAIPTSGFAAGVEYKRGNVAVDPVIFRVSTRASTNRYLHADAELASPALARGRIFLDLLGTYRNFGQLRYYGPGPSSSESGLTNYRLEDAGAEVTGGVRLLRVLRAGATAGYTVINVGPGASGRYRSIEQVFSPVAAPGLLRQSDYATTGGFAEIDYTEQSGSPRSGGVYSARFNNYVAQDFALHSFRRLDVDLRQYIPFFNEQRIIALRAHSAITDWNSGRSVPFYLQPTLGGPEYLRGFRSFRFYGNHMLFFNAEYRWKAARGMELALFTDMGKVFMRRSQLNLHNLERSYGAGLRLNYRKNTFVRLDGACGREGCQIWVRFHENY